MLFSNMDYVKVRDTDAYDPFRLKTVQLYDDFKINGPNGTRQFSRVSCTEN